MLPRINNYAAILWTLCVIGLIFLFLYTTKLATHVPSFSPGGAEQTYLLPMLTLFAVGTLSFLVVFLTFIFSLISKKKKEYRPPLGLSTRRLSITVFVLCLCIFSFFFGFRQASYTETYLSVSYTGQDVFDAVNQHRESKNLSAIVLDPALCDNLVQRWLDLTNPDNKYEGHIGSEKWATNEGLIDKYSLAELYMKNAETPSEAITFWEGSPGHRLALDGDYQYGCAYADKGTSVLILGNRK